MDEPERLAMSPTSDASATASVLRKQSEHSERPFTSGFATTGTDVLQPSRFVSKGTMRSTAITAFLRKTSSLLFAIG